MRRHKALPQLVGAAVFVVFGLAAIRASAGQLIYDWIRNEKHPELYLLAGTGVASLGLAGLFFVFIKRRNWSELPQFSPLRPAG